MTRSSSGFRRAVSDRLPRALRSLPFFLPTRRAMSQARPTSSMADEPPPDDPATQQQQQQQQNPTQQVFPSCPLLSTPMPPPYSKHFRRPAGRPMRRYRQLRRASSI